MRTAKKKPAAPVRIPRARNTHSRQRQRLIDACIAALHIYGPSRTTVEKVVGIAKMSPGIVRFYFASKAAMLVASLQFLAAEFEEQVLMPVSQLKSKPMTALELMVDLYLDPEIASPRKVSVWYAFWGEASSRQEYYDICGQKDERFAALVRELVERLIVETAQPHLDSDGIALGLIGALEILWQEFAFRNEEDIDRIAAKRRCMAYLRSVFPGQFAASESGESESGEHRGLRPGPSLAATRLAAWTYDNAGLFAAEREGLFRGSWQLVGHRAQISGPGDFLTADLGVERALVLEDRAGELRAYRNSCTEAPHTLIPARHGHLGVLGCAVHGVQFDFDGQGMERAASRHLTRLDVRVVGDLIWIRSTPSNLVHVGPGATGTGTTLGSVSAALARAAPDSSSSWPDCLMASGSRPLGSPIDELIEADWKLVMEQALELPVGRTSGERSTWSRAAYDRLATGAANGAADATWEQRWLAPNHWIESRPDGLTLMQVLPLAPGRSLLRRHYYMRCPTERVARIADYLASRLDPWARGMARIVAESTQQGMARFGAQNLNIVSTPEAIAFRERLRTLIPAMALDRPPTGL